jgi:hypothetical protein
MQLTLPVPVLVPQQHKWRLALDPSVGHTKTQTLGLWHCSPCHVLVLIPQQRPAEGAAADRRGEQNGRHNVAAVPKVRHACVHPSKTFCDERFDTDSAVSTADSRPWLLGTARALRP